MDQMIAKRDSSHPTELKRDSKSFEAIQQSVIIAILVRHGFSFEFKKPERFSEKSRQFIMINEVYCNGNPLNFGAKIMEYCDSRFNMEYSEGMTYNQMKLISRHKDINKYALMFNWLLSYAEKIGYTFKKRATKVSNKTLQMKKIYEIEIEKKVEDNDVEKMVKMSMKKNDIYELGCKVNEYIVNKLKVNNLYVSSKEKEIVDMTNAFYVANLENDNYKPPDNSIQQCQVDDTSKGDSSQKEKSSSGSASPIPDAPELPIGLVYSNQFGNNISDCNIIHSMNCQWVEPFYNQPHNVGYNGGNYNNMFFGVNNQYPYYEEYHKFVS